MKFLSTVLLFGMTVMKAAIAEPTCDVTQLKWDQLLPEDRLAFELDGWTEQEWGWYEGTLRWHAVTSWDKLGRQRQEGLKKLGWTEKMWIDAEDTCKYHRPVVESKPFSRLTPEERAIAEDLGFNQYTWHVKELEHRHLGYFSERDYYNDTSTSFFVPEDYGFTPFVVKMDVPELDMFKWDKLKTRDDVMLGVDDNTKNGEAGNDEALDWIDMSMKEFIERILDGEKLYIKYENESQDDIKMILGDVNPADVIRKALEKAAPPELLAKGNFGPEHVAGTSELRQYAMLYIGGKETTTQAHIDFLGFNFLWVAEGRKRVVLYPNDQRTAANFTSGLEIDYSFWPDIDILSHPLPPHAVEIILGPGEGVHIPYYTWHAVENLEPSIAFGMIQDFGPTMTPKACYDSAGLL